MNSLPPNHSLKREMEGNVTAGPILSSTAYLQGFCIILLDGQPGMDSKGGRGEIQVKKKKNVSYLQVLEMGGTGMVRRWRQYSGHSLYWGSMEKAGWTVRIDLSEELTRLGAIQTVPTCLLPGCGDDWSRRTLSPGLHRPESGVGSEWVSFARGMLLAKPLLSLRISQ